MINVLVIDMKQSASCMSRRMLMQEEMHVFAPSTLQHEVNMTT